ncbi:MAG: HAD family hydrolase [Lachnospiraceae bacterium]|nr:HAD family hydrolase [Lachnospiraceae bacterium]
MQILKRVKSRERNIHKSNFQRPAVFLDRDGVLAEETGYVNSVERLCIFPYAAECIRKIHEKGYYAIVITNQSGVARGLFTEERLLEMNRYLQQYTDVDAVLYCPHHPEGVVEEYRIRCNCRKPAIGMFQNACRRLDIDMTNSYMVGDRAGDIIAGQNAGIKTILVESGYGTVRLEEDVMPDYVVDDLRGVLEIL